MPWHFLFMGEAEDSVLVNKAFPTDFIHYLKSKVPSLPKMIVSPGFSAGAVFTPFGWNKAAIASRENYHNQPPFPFLESVRRVNSRSFSLSVEKELFAENQILEFDDLKKLENYLAKNIRRSGWVIKANHGHAGTANRRVGGKGLSSLELTDEDRKILTQYFLEHDKVVLEPWHERVVDLAVNFDLDSEGNISHFRGHELINSFDGSFLGIKISPDRHPTAEWRDELEASMLRLSKVLHGNGYFGPVSVDAYVHQGDQAILRLGKPVKPVLRPMVDINARFSMAAPIHNFAKNLPGKWVLWMWIKPKKINGLSDYLELEKRFDEYNFNLNSQTGILATSPVFLDANNVSESLNPKRIGFLFSAHSEAHLHAMQNHFSLTMRKN